MPQPARSPVAKVIRGSQLPQTPRRCADEDLNAVVTGIKFVRRLATAMNDDNLIAEEETPGADVQGDEQPR